MSHSLKIYIARLSEERTEKIEETLPPEFIDVNEKDLQFKSPVFLKGKAYLAEDHLIIQLNVKTKMTAPCAICNEKIQKKIYIPSFYLTEELENIRGQVYDYSNSLREAILLEVPSHVECRDKCPKREELKNYLSKEETQFPFADLN